MLTKSFQIRSDKYPLFRFFALLVFAAFLLTACSSETPTPVLPPPSTDTPGPTPIVIDVNLLYDKTWVLVAYGEPSNPIVVEEGLALTAEFTPDGLINGFSGCNNYSGTFQAAQDGSISISPLATTMMACAEAMEIENIYLSALQNVRSFRFNDEGRLEITFASQSDPDQVLIFVNESKPLTGTNWVLVSFGDPAAPQAAPTDTVITAAFSPDGMVSGFSGCNQYNASYTVQDVQLTLGPITMTRMACPTGMEAEQAYLQALGTAQQYAIKGQKLTITYNQGAGVLTYTAANLPLEYTLWTLTMMNGQAVSAESTITASFVPGEDPNTGTVSGSSGCNSYNAGYTKDGNVLTVQPAATTMMACPTGMDTEQAYLQALVTSTSYQIFGDRLFLTSPSGTLMFLANRTPLGGALWKLVALGDIKNPVSPVEGSNFTAQFNLIPGFPSGVLAGTTGCNEYSAAFTANVTEIKINLPASTQNKSCVPGLTDQEVLYYLALNSATTYTIYGNTLILPYDSGKQALVFEGTQLETAERPALSTLNGTTWFLWYTNNVTLVAGTSIYAQFTINPDGSSGTMNGSAGCNGYSATFGQDLGVQTTLNASQVCNEPAGVMEQEAAYINMLSRAYGYWLVGDQLIINSGLGVLTYRTSQPPESFDQSYLLTDQTWYLIAYKDIYSVPGTQEPYTKFAKDGTLSGFTGCNAFQATYTTYLQEITIANMNVTLSGCPNAALQAQEDAMLQLLPLVKSFQVVDTVMQLIADQGILNYSITPLNRPEEVAPPTAIINMPGTVLVGQIVTFDGSASYGQLPIIKWKWDFGDGVQATGPVVDHVYKTPGAYTVSLTVTDQYGTKDTDSLNFNVTAPVAPTPVPTQAPQATPTVEATQAPQATPTVEATQAPPPTPEPTQPPAIPPQASIQGPGQGYVSEPITFDATGSVSGSSPIVSYAWNFGDGVTLGPSSEPSVATIFNQTGSYQVSVVVTDQNGQSSSATMEVIISTRLDTPVVWVLDRLGSQDVLPGTAITLQFIGGQLAGFSGCNTYSGGYSVVQNDDGTYGVTISGLSVTSMACPGEIMAQESTYLAILPAVMTAQIQGNVLNLNYPEGSLVYYQAGTATPY